jgi:hypothetical protein
MESNWKVAVDRTESRNQQKQSNPKPKKQPKTSTEPKPPTYRPTLIFVSKNKHKKPPQKITAFTIAKVAT